MELISAIHDMQEWSRKARARGKTIAFVPTMGFLHQGHLSLMEEGKRRGDCLVVSIFVNPTQFGVGEDFEQYPRDSEGDREKVLRAGGDVIFSPSAKEMYFPDFQTSVTVEKVTKNLCGLSRPTHFQGVTTVVAKLFNIVSPHVALFGEKDYQQLVAIRQMVKDLNFDIQIIGMPTVREHDGLAMSSRNKHLNEEERKEALCLQAVLECAEVSVRGGVVNARRLVEEATSAIAHHRLASVDYVKVCDPRTLEDIDTLDGEALMALAVRIGKTRLIDNRLLRRV